MLKAADLKKTDTVVEIGPGFGVLTLALAGRVEKVITFEIEQKLKPYWERLLEDQEIKGPRDQKIGKIEILWGNVLHKLKNRSSDLPIFRSPYKVIANLPYQITSHVLRTLLESENKPESITVMVQKEVADRIVAKPGDMSLLSVSVQYYGKPKIVCKVPKGSFWPQPKVDSTVVHISTRARQHLSTFSDKEFFKVAKTGFANKRKQLWHNLSEGLKIDKDKIKEILVEVVGSEKVRAQELSVENWFDVVKLVT